MIQQARPNQIVTLEDSDFSALVTVEKGNVSAELLQSELARILPVQWTWSARVNGDKSYIVPFPCKEELDRMVAIRNITTKNQEGTLRFEELEADVQPIRVLDQVWVTVTNVPRILKSYLPLWAVGSCIGATQKVDMVHLRKTGEVRILVAAFDVKAIAKQVDICVNRSIYRVYFTADAEVTDDSFNPDEDDLLEDDSNKGLDGNGDHHMDDATDDNNKNQQSSDASNQSSGKQLGGAAPPPQHHAALVEDALTLACNSLLDEICCKVIMEKDDGAVDARYSPPSAEEVASFEALIHGSGMQDNTSHFFLDVTVQDPVVAATEVGTESTPTVTSTSQEAPRGAASGDSNASPASLLGAHSAGATAGSGGAALCPVGVEMPQPSDGNRPTAEPETAALAGQLASPVDTSAGEQEGAALAAHPGLLLHGPVQPMHGTVQHEHELAGLPPTWEPTEAPLGTEEALTATVPAANQQAKGWNLVEGPTVCRSARNKATTDEHTLKKTARMAAKKNLESIGSSFTSFSDNRITSNLNNIGINLGSTASAIISSTIAIKNLEIDRLAL